MDCLFGVCGSGAADILTRMAGRLAHRCQGGWQRLDGQLSDGTPLSMARGWCGKARPRHLHSTPQGMLGIAGQIDHIPQHADEIPDRYGAFVLALGDQDQLLLARDPAGVKVLYWAESGDRLLFASEVKALFADPDLPRQLRPGALPEYLSFSFIPGSGTMFQGVHELEPGTTLRWQQGRTKVHRHFCPEAQLPNERPAWSAGELRQELAAATQECLREAPPRPGVALSGGVDSSAVLALACQQLGPGLPTFSVDFGPGFPNENPFIELMVRRYQTEHHRLSVQPQEFLNRFADIIYRLDEPIGDPVTVPNFLLAQRASQVTSLMLNGEGGDPCFGGPKNIPMLLAKLYGPPPGEPTEGFLERCYLASFGRCYQDLEKLLSPELLAAAGGREALEEHVRPFIQGSQPAALQDRLHWLNIRRKGANLILVKVEKMSCGHGLTALPPLFTRRIIEASLALPAAQKLNGPEEKWLLKEAVRDLLPAPIIVRPKSGMQVPIRFWFRGELRRYIRRQLAPRQVRRNGLLNADTVKHLASLSPEVLSDRAWGFKLWMLLTFVYWHEQLVETPVRVTQPPMAYPSIPVPLEKGS